MRITLVIYAVWGGGAERAASLLANCWTEQGHEVSVLTFEEQDGVRYPIATSVKVRHLDLFRQSRNFREGLFHNLRRIRVLRRAIRESRPDVVISFGCAINILTVLATRQLGLRVVIRETADPLEHRVGTIWGVLRRLLYPLADMLVCPNSACLAKVQTITKVPGTVIPNLVFGPPMVKQSQRVGWGAGHQLVAMGRLVREKGFDFLLAAFSLIASQNPDWSLTIIGKGPLRSELEQRSIALKLAGRVHFAGELADPFPVLCAADLFVFSSRYETFGNALAEAMACGLPVVSFDCPDGPRTIVRHGIDGILVPARDVSALAAALNRLMSDPGERVRLGARAREVTVRFSSGRILSLWQNLFAQLVPSEAPFQWVPDELPFHAKQ